MNQMSDADQQFLRKMAGHHQGMIEMGRIAEQRGGEDVRMEAQTMAAKQRAEIDLMMGKLSEQGGSATPQMDGNSQAMVQQLERAGEDGFDQEFRRVTIQHHQMGIEMADQFMPQLSQELQIMAEQMRAEQSAEIRAQEQKMRMGM